MREPQRTAAAFATRGIGVTFPEFGPSDTAEGADALKEAFKESCAIWYTDCLHSDFRCIFYWGRDPAVVFPSAMTKPEAEDWPRGTPCSTFQAIEYRDVGHQNVAGWIETSRATLKTKSAQAVSRRRRRNDLTSLVQRGDEPADAVTPNVRVEAEQWRWTVLHATGCLNLDFGYG